MPPVRRSDGHRRSWLDRPRAARGPARCRRRRRRGRRRRAHLGRRRRGEGAPAGGPRLRRRAGAIECRLAGDRARRGRHDPARRASPTGSGPRSPASGRSRWRAATSTTSSCSTTPTILAGMRFALERLKQVLEPAGAAALAAVLAGRDPDPGRRAGRGRPVRAGTSRSAGSASCSRPPARCPGPAAIRPRSAPADDRRPSGRRRSAWRPHAASSGPASTCSPRRPRRCAGRRSTSGAIVARDRRRRSPSRAGPSRSRTVHLTVRAGHRARGRRGRRLVRRSSRSPGDRRPAGRVRREPDHRGRDPRRPPGRPADDDATRRWPGRAWCSGGSSWASIIAGIPLAIAQGVVQARSSTCCCPWATRGRSSPSILAAALVGAPFAYVLSGVVLGDVGAGRGRRRARSASIGARKVAAAIVAALRDDRGPAHPPRPQCRPRSRPARVRRARARRRLRARPASILVTIGIVVGDLRASGR